MRWLRQANLSKTAKFHLKLTVSSMEKVLNSHNKNWKNGNRLSGSDPEKFLHLKLQSNFSLTKLNRAISNKASLATVTFCQHSPPWQNSPTSSELSSHSKKQTELAVTPCDCSSTVKKEKLLSTISFHAQVVNQPFPNQMGLNYGSCCLRKHGQKCVEATKTQ